MFKTAWQLIMSPFACIAWLFMALVLLIGWGPNQVRLFIEAWMGMIDEGPITGGPLPPDPVPPLENPNREKGEGIG